jgi:hypothetical protein
MKKILFLYLLLSALITANGQVEKLILPSDLKQQTIVTEPVTLRKGYIRTEINITYIAQDKYFSDEGMKEYYPVSMWGSKYQYNLNVKYGIADRFEIDLYVPIVDQRIENYFVLKMPATNQDLSVSSKLKGRGIGDCSIMFKYQIFPEKDNKISLSVFNEVSFPTGPKNPTDIKDFNDYKLPTGYGYFSTGIWLYARKIHYPYSYTAMAHYYYNFWGSKLIYADDAAETKFKKGDRMMVGGSFNCHLNDWIALANELYFFHFGKGEEKNVVSVKTDPSWEIDYVPKLVFQFRRFRISEFVMIPLKGKNTGSDPAYSLSVQYTF